MFMSDMIIQQTIVDIVGTLTRDGKRIYRENHKIYVKDMVDKLGRDYKNQRDREVDLSFAL